MDNTMDLDSADLDEFDDDDLLSNLPSSSLLNLDSASTFGANGAVLVGSGKKEERTVRRRSSKGPFLYLSDLFAFALTDFL